MNEITTLDMFLRTLHLPSMLREYESFAQKARKNKWGHENYLKSLCEIEVQDRNNRRIQRNLRKSNLPDGKTIATLELERLPQHVRNQIPVLLEGDFVQRSENVLCFGLPGRGKSHLICAIAHELIIHKGYEVLFTSTFSLVQKLLKAKRESLN